MLDSTVNITLLGSAIDEGLEEEWCSRCGSCTRPMSAVSLRALTPIHLRFSDFEVVVRVIWANWAVANCRKYKLWSGQAKGDLLPDLLARL